MKPSAPSAFANATQRAITSNDFCTFGVAEVTACEEPCHRRGAALAQVTQAKSVAALVITAACKTPKACTHAVPFTPVQYPRWQM